MRNSVRRLALPDWVAISGFLLVLTLLMVYLDWLWRWDQLLYDAQLRLWSRPPPEDIIIVAIDDASLSELGRWPWSRRVHAELVRRLTDAGARVIALDILFAEPDAQDPQSDLILSNALTDSGRVFLPIVIEQRQLGGQLLEALPIPQLTQAAAGLGHVHIDLDPDGIARKVYLLEGLGDPYWPSLSVALLRQLESGRWQELPGSRHRNRSQNSPLIIVRDHQVFIPFAGPPGHFPRISYTQALKGEFMKHTFQDKIVLVGVTATGLGDALPTPVSGLSQPMPGVEINANLIDSLRRGITVRLIDLHWRMLLSVVLVLLPLLVYPRLTPRFLLVAGGAFLVITLLFSMLLLQGFHIWFPPAAVLLGQILSYPLWSWRRLENTMRYLEQELERLHGEPSAVPFYRRSLRLSDGLKFLQRIMPFDGWLLRDEADHIIEQQGKTPDPPPHNPSKDRWYQRGDNIWISIPQDKDGWLLGIRWTHGESVAETDKQLLTEFTRQYSSPTHRRPGNTAELIENRIQQVQSAISQLRTMRGFISDTLRQMGDGLLVVNPVGQVVLANEHAARYLRAEPNADLEGAKLMELMEELEIQGSLTWPQAVQSVLIARKDVSIESRHPSGIELFVQMSPLSVAEGKTHGMIINLSDISLLKYSERKRAEALSFLSHDLRSPITSLLSLVQLSREKNNNPKEEEMLGSVEHYARKALKLAEDFLQLARAENVDKTNFSETDFVTVAYNAMDEAYTEAQAKNIRLIRHDDIDEAWLQADAGLLERALTNLVSNAIKYSPEGARIELRLTAKKDVIECCIEDHGIGIPHEHLSKIFDPFYRLEGTPRRSESGAGLGLAFVKVVAEKHGGSVRVSSTPGKGSCFCIRLPHDSETA